MLERSACWDLVVGIGPVTQTNASRIRDALIAASNPRLTAWRRAGTHDLRFFFAKGSGARRLTQSPELGFGLGLSSYFWSSGGGIACKCVTRYDAHGADLIDWCTRDAAAVGQLSMSSTNWREE
jgi:hypothetical protein